MKKELERKARRYRDLARQLSDDQAYSEIRLALECEAAAAAIASSPATLHPGVKRRKAAYGASLLCAMSSGRLIGRRTEP